MAKHGTFLVTHADDDSVVLKDTADGQVHTLATNPDPDGDALAADEAIEATIAPEPPLEVAWELREIEDRRSLTVERSPEPPTTQEREIAADQEQGDLTRRERAGIGEIHVLTVPPDQTDDAVADVLGDEATLVRAADLGVERVEVRADDEGVVSVRYMP
ncbi:DUF5812 family protein [Halococcus saccharolyticus]|uniref:Uncharacterized protein n=1 Tax=Halococcus saccharolyticus DSM 5350 TaxID=1227455 RepID=M0MEP0_9EURY|nr:DUF5812 family protein [Halococcus saccharolyticus]EMA43129.1 hypothetical protein C449_14162 [Halococcus saccharolyticus DSM 5350]